MKLSEITKKTGGMVSNKERMKLINKNPISRDLSKLGYEFYQEDNKKFPVFHETWFFITPDGDTDLDRWDTFDEAVKKAKQHYDDDIRNKIRVKKKAYRNRKPVD